MNITEAARVLNDKMFKGAGFLVYKKGRSFVVEKVFKTPDMLEVSSKGKVFYIGAFNSMKTAKDHLKRLSDVLQIQKTAASRAKIKSQCEPKHVTEQRINQAIDQASSEVELERLLTYYEFKHYTDSSSRLGRRNAKGLPLPTFYKDTPRAEK